MAAICIFLGLVVLYLSVFLAQLGIWEENPAVLIVSGPVGTALTGYGAWAVGLWWGVLIAAIGLYLCLLLLGAVRSTFPTA